MEDNVSAHTARAEAEIACGRASAVIGELETLTAEHPYHEPLWAQLITAYYVTERQSDALNAYRRLETALADGLGIDPGPTVSALYVRILRQEPLGVKRSSPDHPQAEHLRTRSPVIAPFGASASPAARPAGRQYPLTGAATRIGRLADNDIVLDDDEDVSRHHAVIIDTGTGFVIYDSRSTNGVEVQPSAHPRQRPLTDADRIRIGSHEFTVEIRPS